MKKFYFFLSLLFLLNFSQHSWGQIKLGNNPSRIDPTALLELDSTTHGLLLPRMTSAQRDAIPMDTSPVGLMIYNTDIDEIQYLYEATTINAKGEQRQVLLWESATDDTIPFTRPTNPEVGQLFYDTAAEQLNLWDGSAWVAVGVNLANSGGATSTISYQNLTLVGTQLSISNGNTVDFSSLTTTITGPIGPQGPAGPQGDPATDDQTLTASALSANNTLTIAISGGNTEVIDLSNLNQDIIGLNFDSKTNSLTVGITDGASQTVDLSNLNQDIAELALDSMTNSLTVGITDGASQTISLDKLQQDIDGLAYNSTTNSLTVGITGGASQTISLATLGSTTVSGSLTINSGTSSYTLPIATGGAGQVLAIENASSGTTTWTTITAGGTTTAITGLVSVTEGGNIGHRIATREANNHGDIGSNAVDLSYSNVTSSTLHGATGFGSFAAGSETRASGTRSTALGHRTLASGNHTVAIGYTAQASEEYAVALGRGQAQGEDAFAVGPGVFAYSLAEVALGSYPSIYTATSKTAWIPTDRLLVLGNGTGIASRSDALVILKDGTTTLNGALTINASSTTTSYTLPTAGGSNGQVLSMLDANSGTTTWTSISGGGVFTSNANTLFSSIGTTTHDFIIGSDQIDNITGGDDDARLYFDKSKAAFRAGHASGTTWNDAMVGDRSVASGFNTEASGDRSTAFGNATQALSYTEVALGSYNTTLTPNSTSSWNTNDRLLVVGNGNSSANRSDALVILKNGNTELNGALTLNPTGTSSYTLPTAKGTAGQVLTIDNATTGTTTWTTIAAEASTGLVSVTENGKSGYRLALEPAANHGDIGNLAVDLSIQTGTSNSRGATGLYAFATGQRTIASGARGTAMGYETTASGDRSKAMGGTSTAWGRDTQATGNYSTAWGRGTEASGNYSTAMGFDTKAVGLYATGWGRAAEAIGQLSTAWGFSSIASASYSTAFGEETTAESYGQTSLGFYNTSHPGTPNALASVAGDRLLVVGNGTFTNRSDALVILKNGNVGIGDSTPTEGTLVVSGTVVASGNITANATLTPDYVFESYFNGASEANPAYRFPSLVEVEAFIKENYHLPNVASAAEVKEQGGIVLNRASEVQLEKIEELYLHTIEQQKQLGAQQEQLAAQQKEIETLKAMIKHLMERE